MKILITGALGQVGSELTKLSIQRGHEAIPVDAQMLDITKPQAIALKVGEIDPDVIINAAAYTAVDKAETEREAAQAVNVTGAKNLADACAKANIPLLHISTDYVFNGDKKGEYVESDTPAPTSVYGRTKLDGDRAVAKALDKHIILRVSWVFGANGNNFVKTMLRLAESRDELGVVDDQYGAPTSAVAIARTLLDMLDLPDFGTDEFAWGVYHLPATPGVTWHGFAKEIFAQAKDIGLINKEMTVNAIGSDQFPTPVKRPANSKLGSDKLSNLLEVGECDWRTDLQQMLSTLKNKP